ncbi:MAG: DUF2065 domain-containing protein [Chromatiales bacterium]|nr:DUF2065 domain-containing protein [Chromatiales bacterium]
MLLAAFALMLVIEGMLPFVAPAAVARHASAALTELTDGQIRFIGPDARCCWRCSLLLAVPRPERR